MTDTATEPQSAPTAPSGEQVGEHPFVLRLRDYAAKVAGGGPSEPSYDPDTLVMLMDAARSVELLFEVHEASFDDWDSWLLSRGEEWTDEVSGFKSETEFFSENAEVRHGEPDASN